MVFKHIKLFFVGRLGNIWDNSKIFNIHSFADMSSNSCKQDEKAIKREENLEKERKSWAESWRYRISKRHEQRRRGDNEERWWTYRAQSFFCFCVISTWCAKSVIITCLTAVTCTSLSRCWYSYFRFISFGHLIVDGS